MRILLQFAPDQSLVHRKRLTYAFRLFCAIYGYEPVFGDMRRQSPDVMLTYNQSPNDLAAVCLTKAELIRPLSQPAPDPIVFSKDREQTMLFYPPSSEREPDWLAEIFEWVSCADECACTQWDLVGRVPFAASYVGRHGLNPRIPYAAVGMAFLQTAIARIKPRASLKPQPPLPQHFVVNTHDVDYLPKGAVPSSYRLAKNALISLLLYRAGRAAAVQSASAAAILFGGNNPLDQIALQAEREQLLQAGASYYFLCNRAHRRDGNYSIHETSTIDLMHRLEETENMEIGVHGSYCCMEQPESLAAEFNDLRDLGFHPLGGRQHWLRFTIQQLVREVQRAGAAYDASIGWPYDMGFRAGACFAFPPYDFEHEAPAPFLELPLVIMDSASSCERKRRAGNYDNAGPQAMAQVLASSRRYGWGGTSVLWHPTAFGGGQYPEEVGNFFWRLLAEGLNYGDTWLSAASFARTVWHRYQNAGLLPERSWQ